MSKQPRAIPYLFLTEMWERFSYYGITAILILYMDHSFAFSKEKVYAVYGAYGALVYMTPILGGYLADKALGSVNAVIIGAVFITLGHFIVAIPSAHLVYFYLGLSIIITGTGLFSPNINAIVGHLYEEHDIRREGGFTLTYMGRNIGTILAPLVCAYVAAQYDWHYAFIVAGIGMLLGLFVFMRGQIHYNGKSFVSNLTTKRNVYLTLLLLGLTGCVFLMMEHPIFVGPTLLILVLFLASLIIRYCVTHPSVVVKKNVYKALVLTFFYIIFMILLQQSGGALNLFTDSFVDRNFFGIEIQTGMFQSVEPLALVMLAPLYNYLWRALSKREKAISDELKFMFGLILMSSSFILMAVAMNFANHQGLISMSWINLTYVLQAAGELCIGPIGLAMISRLIPNEILGLYMGIWVLAAAVANFIAAKIGAYITPNLSGLSSRLLHEVIYRYQHAFMELALFGFAAAFMLFITHKLAKRR